MGLAEPRKRRKISSDPNNTTWSRNTTNYGHRLLAAQGWTPGQFLGAVDAAHAAHYTAANASHVRVMLREENAGIGASRFDAEGRKGVLDRENFGVGGLQDVLRRLNGRTEEVEEERKRGREREMRMYAGAKFGVGRFVSGGFLVGDAIVKRGEAMPGTSMVVAAVGEGGEEGGARGEDSEAKLKRKKERGKKERGKKEKREKKEKKNKKEGETGASTDSEEPPKQEKESNAERRKRKEEKRARREARKLRKQHALHTEAVSQETEDDKDTPKGITATEATASDASLPSTPTTRPEQHARGRQNVRSRYIAQKKMALADPKALREIFMVKA